MTIGKFLFPAMAVAAFFATESGAQIVRTNSEFSYADLADLAVNAPIAVEAEVRSAVRLKDAGGSTAGVARFFVEADVLALIRGTGGLPPRINYIADVPLDARGKAPKLKKMRVILLARRVPGKADSVQLMAPDAQIPWSESTSDRIRGILNEATARGAPPRITGVGNAFHTPGAIPGEGETQIFLNTETGDPVSLLVLRRPGQAPRWAVAMGEIVDEAARPPAVDTLLWYRLACSLPARLPDSSLEGTDPAQAQTARADYSIIRRGLGACTRTRATAPVAGAQAPSRSM